jgi:hypothetical protein
MYVSGKSCFTFGEARLARLSTSMASMLYNMLYLTAFENATFGAVF